MSLPKDPLEPYRTDLRRELIARRRERSQRWKRGLKGSQGRLKPDPSRQVTIDTSRARSNGGVLRLVIQDLGWKEYTYQRSDYNCDVTWFAGSFQDQTEIYSGKVNKFPGSSEIFKKVNTFRWLEFMRTLFPQLYDFFPRTWILPYQYQEFANQVRPARERRSRSRTMYIAKPSEGSQGQGIFLLEDVTSYSNLNHKPHVVQEYLSDVFLLDSYKFDLRVYVVLRSLQPLEFHICREGLARLSTVPYQPPSHRNMHQTLMHLTNYSLNKKSDQFQMSDKDDEGSKRKMSSVFQTLEQQGHDTQKIWKNIEELVIKTLLAVTGEMKVEHQSALPPGLPGPSCFQVLGFDVILLRNLRPMLLEVNSSPSLSISEERTLPEGEVQLLVSAKDEEVKRTLIRDTLMLVAPRHKWTRPRRNWVRRQTANCRSDQESDSENSDQQVIYRGNEGELSLHQRNYRRNERDLSLQHVEEDESDNQRRSMFEGFEPALRKPVPETSDSTSDTESDGPPAESPSSYEKEAPSKERENQVYESSETLQLDVHKISTFKSWFRKKLKRKKSPALLDVNANLVLPPLMLQKERSSEKLIGEDDEEDCLNPVHVTEVKVDQDVPSPDANDERDEDSDGGEEVESCLKEIFPSLYGDIFSHERIVDKLADVFIKCLGGGGGGQRMSCSRFRQFARRCQLHQWGMTGTDLDQYYMEMLRTCQYADSDRNPATGINFFAFVFGCCKLACDLIPGNTVKSKINAFVEHCQISLKISSKGQGGKVRQLLPGLHRDKLKVGTLKLPQADDKSKSRNANFPTVDRRDRTLPSLSSKHRNVFHLLQTIKK